MPVGGAHSFPVSRRVTYVFPSLRKDCLADVTADGGGQEPRTGARRKVALRSVLHGPPTPRAPVLRLTCSRSHFLSFLSDFCEAQDGIFVFFLPAVTCWVRAQDSVLKVVPARRSEAAAAAGAASEPHQNRSNAALTQLASHPSRRQVMLASSRGRISNQMKEIEPKAGPNLPGTERSTSGES